MGVEPEDTGSDAYERFRAEAQRFFDAQLERIGLSEAQIESQDITELEDSLARVDDALRSPESFGVLKLSVSANAAVFIVKSDTASHIEVGVVPLLLERKKMIVDRLRLLRKQRPISTLTELINSVSDSGLRDQLRTELEATRHVGSSQRHAAQIRRNYAFIAMAMDPQDPQLDDVLDAIKDGAMRSNVVAERIDERATNEPITRRMLKAIEEAEYVVVDLTNPRPNVYYEAGYAQGMGKTPVYVARQGVEIPFDVQDYPVILYPNMRELKNSLAERLESIRAAQGTERDQGEGT
jgi:hypothetical protein